MNILVHLRRGKKNFYLRMVEIAFPEANIVTLADERSKAMIWTGDYLYSKSAKGLQNYFEHSVMEDIRIRCRFLRKLKVDKAYYLINSLAYGFKKLFEEQKFDFVMGELIDCYVQDVLNRIATENHVLYVSFIGHFFNGYARISARGELIDLGRDVTEEEIQAVLQDLLQRDYKPNFELNKQKKALDVARLYMREVIKRYAFFFLKLLRKDPDNYHYNTVIESTWYFLKTWRFNMDKFLCHISDVTDLIDENTVYLPLHYSPEATIDYWCDDPMFSYQEKTIIELIENMPGNILLLVKEHPAMYMKREISFYKRLKSFNNVRIIHPYDNSNLLLEKVTNVAVFTGSVGVEALLRGKRVFTFTKNYYSDLHPNIHKVSALNEEILKLPIENYPSEKFAKDLLQGMLQANFYNTKILAKSDVNNNMVTVLKTYVSQKLSEKE